MNMQVVSLTLGPKSRNATAKLCWIEVTSAEALELIKSLVNQLQGGPNRERLESRCEGDASELSVAIVDAPQTTNLREIGMPLR